MEKKRENLFYYKRFTLLRVRNRFFSIHLRFSSEFPFDFDFFWGASLSVPRFITTKSVEILQTNWTAVFDQNRMEMESFSSLQHFFFRGFRSSRSNQIFNQRLLVNAMKRSRNTGNNIWRFVRKKWRRWELTNWEMWRVARREKKKLEKRNRFEEHQ